MRGNALLNTACRVIVRSAAPVGDHRTALGPVVSLLLANGGDEAAAPDGERGLEALGPACRRLPAWLPTDRTPPTKCDAWLRSR